MEPTEFVLAIIAIAIGGAIAITAIVKGIDLIKTWINRNNASYNEENFERLAKAFIQHKKDAERRFQNLEAIATDDMSVAAPISSPSKNIEKKSHQSIEIEANSADEAEEEQGNLKNMLNKKRSR